MWPPPAPSVRLRLPPPLGGGGFSLIRPTVTTSGPISRRPRGIASGISSRMKASIASRISNATADVVCELFITALEAGPENAAV